MRREKQSFKSAKSPDPMVHRSPPVKPPRVGYPARGIEIKIVRLGCRFFLCATTNKGERAATTKGYLAMRAATRETLIKSNRTKSRFLDSAELPERRAIP